MYGKSQVKLEGSQVAAEQIGDTLRAARLAHKIPLKRIAAELDLDPSYLSHVEHNRRPASPEIVAAYNRHTQAGLSAVAATKRDSFVLDLIRWFQKLRPYDRKGLCALSLSKYTTDEDPLSNFSTALIQFSPLAEGDRIILVWESPIDYINSVSRHTWRRVLQVIAQSAARMTILFAPSPNFEAHETLGRLIREATRCLQFKELVTLDSVADLPVSHFPVDFMYVPRKFAIIRFAGRQYSRNNSLMITSTKFDDPDVEFDEPLKRHLERIESYRDQKLTMYFADEDMLQFFEDYAATEELGGPRYLFQSWPGSHDRPPEDYDENTNWWKYYLSMFEKLQLDTVTARQAASRLAKARKRAWEAVRRRMTTYPVRQICSADVLKRWAAEGRRPGFRPDEDEDDRIHQLDYIVNTLRAYPLYRIAIVEHSLAGELGWSESRGRRNLSWLVQGQEKIIIEGHARDTLHRFRQYRCIIRDPAIAGRFRSVFEELWNSLPLQSIDPRNTIEFLLRLKSDVQRAKEMRSKRLKELDAS